MILLTVLRSEDEYDAGEWIIRIARNQWYTILTVKLLIFP